MYPHLVESFQNDYMHSMHCQSYLDLSEEVKQS